MRKAVDLIPDGHPDKPRALNILAQSLGSRFDRLGSLLDIEAAFDASQKAVKLTPLGHADRPNLLFDLAAIYIQRNLRLDSASDRVTALDAVRASAQSSVGNPRARLHYANVWARMCELSNDGRQALLAYARVMSLIPQTAWAGLEMDHRHEQLQKLHEASVPIGGLVNKAAAAAVRYGEPSLALEWLEQGRSVVWGQMLQLRSSFDILLERDFALAQLLPKSRAILSRIPKPQTCQVRRVAENFELCL